MRINKGFSLIEVLVGVAIIITVTTVVLSMIVSTFRISNKSTTDSIVRQNGNYALSQITRMLQFADSFEGVSMGSDVGVDDDYDPLCNTASPEIISHIKFKHDNADKYFTCSGSAMEVGDGASMNTSIDTSKFDIVGCEMTCQQSGYGDGPVVNISFDLDTKAGESLVEKKASQHFSTTIKMRNP